jgi:apolipoprotein N-acyltransferase
MVDAVGRVIGSLPLGSEGVLDARLPRAIPAPLYARFGDGPAAAFVGLVLLLVMRRRFI